MLAALLALVTASGCSSSKSPKRTTTSSTTSTVPATEVTAQAFSPEKGSVQGFAGTGMVVDLAFRSRDAGGLDARPRLGIAGKPGRNAEFPGLVVTLSTTSQTLGGPATNLADLFQIIGVSKLEDGSSEVWATWTNAKPLFGVDVDSVLEAYVVRGEAPATLPEGRTGVEVVSNVISVPFHIAGPAPEVGSDTSTSQGPSTTARTARSTTTRVTRATTTSVRPTPTSAVSTTVTAPPSVTTTTSGL